MPTARLAPIHCVLLALSPGLLLSVPLVGSGIILNLALASLGALLAEALWLRLRGPAASSGLADGSALLSGLLLGLAVPPAAPWWLPLLGGALAITLGKQVFGGRGRNPLNPAMLGYALLLLVFPTAMRAWPAPAPLFADAGLWASQLTEAFGATPDAVGGATMLATWREGLNAGLALSELPAISTGALLASGGGWPALAWLAGGVWLLKRRVIDWRIPVGVLAGITLAALPLWMSDTDRHLSPLLHMLAGASVLAAFFIATDPVTSVRGTRAALLQGLGIGLLIVALRIGGPFPDAAAFAVLLLNLCVPWLRARSTGNPGRIGWPGLALAGLGVLVLLLGRPLASDEPSLETHVKELLAGHHHDNLPLNETERLTALETEPGAPVRVYRARLHEAPVANVYDLVTHEGWGGNMRLLVAQGTDGVITGVRIVSHHETPGLVGELLRRGGWTEAFTGLGPADAADAARIDAVSGATVSARAVRLAVARVLDYAAAPPFERDASSDTDGAELP